MSKFVLVKQGERFGVSDGVRVAPFGTRDDAMFAIRILGRHSITFGEYITEPAKEWKPVTE